MAPEEGRVVTRGPMWVVIHNPHEYEWPDVFGPFGSRGDAEWWMERYVEHNGLDPDDCVAQQELLSTDYDRGE